MKLTKALIDKLECPENRDQIFFRDEYLKGFALRITKKNSRSFVIEKLIDRKVKRITIGQYPALTLEQARKEAQKLLGKIITGINPIIEKQKSKLVCITLEEALDDYKLTRNNLKEKTKDSYEKIIKSSFTEWLNKPILFITKDKIIKKHAELGARGKAYANLSMRILRAILNFAAVKYENSNGESLIQENPAKILSKTKSWYTVKRRKTFIKKHQLFDWYKSIMSLENDVVRDYLLAILLTGTRRNELATLKKENIDLKGRYLEILDTKNNNTHQLPLTDFLHDLFKRRMEASYNDFLFPGKGKTGHIVEIRKQIAHATKASNISFTVHDLRRTFITIAESLDISAYALKKLLNHSTEDDVTAGYIIFDVDRLRVPMDKISHCILQKCHEKPNEDKQTTH